MSSEQFNLTHYDKNIAENQHISLTYYLRIITIHRAQKDFLSRSSKQHKLCVFGESRKLMLSLKYNEY